MEGTASHHIRLSVLHPLTTLNAYQGRYGLPEDGVCISAEDTPVVAVFDDALGGADAVERHRGVEAGWFNALLELPCGADQHPAHADNRAVGRAEVLLRAVVDVAHAL